MRRVRRRLGTTMHVSSTARRYGRALSGVAIAQRKEKSVGEELEGLWAFFRDTPVARLVLESPASSNERREELLAAVENALSETAGGLTPITAHFMRLLSENRRFHLFREIVESYRQEIDRYHGVVEVAVRSAQPLDDDQREALRGTLQRSIVEGKEVRLDLAVDPSLIAGVVAKVGSLVYDGSLKRQLAQVRQQLISE